MAISTRNIAITKLKEIPFYRIIKVVRISEKKTGPNYLYFSEKLYKWLWVALDYFPHIFSFTLETRGEATGY